VTNRSAKGISISFHHPFNRAGISTEDWDRVHVVAVDIVNASAVGDDVLCAHHTQRLLDILDELEVTYGRIPSILDTRADYTDDATVAIALYEEALAATEDPDLACLVLPSLIRLMIEEHHDESSISRRILQLEQLTDQEKCFELEELQELQSNFEELKKQNNRRASNGG
jgi:hypothetical protein